MDTRTSNKNIQTSSQLEFIKEQNKYFVFHVKSLLDQCHSSVTRLDRIRVVRELFKYLFDTQPLWMEKHTFKRVVREKVFEFMDEPELYDEMVETVLHYGWDYCGLPTKKGTECCHKVNIRKGIFICHQHNPLSAWYQRTYNNRGTLWGIVLDNYEPVVETIVENIVEPVVENIVDPVVENIVDPVVENIVEPVVDNSYADILKKTWDAYDAMIGVEQQDQFVIVDQDKQLVGSYDCHYNVLVDEDDLLDYVDY